MFVPKIEKLLGIEVYATTSLGIGGVIRQSVEDFVVEELLVDGSKAGINQSVAPPALGSSSERNRYLLCVLVKRNWDTFQAIRAVADRLGINARRIDIAGIKDAKAVTAQYVTVQGVSAEDVEGVVVKDVVIRPVGYFRNGLSSYYLFGNHFKIKIGAVTHSRSTIKKRIEKTMEELEALGGAPNFFGHQRFGTTRPVTHLVGKAFVKGNLKKATMLFLARSSPYEHPESRQAREQLQATQNFQQALKNFPKQLRYERLMLKHLALKQEDFVGAFRRLPAKLRELFPQAYQAYLFNEFLSRRIEGGLALNKAMVGDYAMSVERSGLSMPTMYRTANTETLSEISRAVKNGKMRVAIPLIGFKQRPSQGVQGEIETRVLEEEGISPEDFRNVVMPEISARGELRAVTTPINDFSLSEISEKPANLSTRKARVGFVLHRGSYATIVLRELMKPRNPIKSGF